MRTSPHILVVDDDAAVRRMLENYLTTQSFRVSLAANRRECDAILADSRIDLVVLDIMLPDASGLDICRDIRKRVPVILLTALNEEIDRIIGLEIGADDYLSKPFNPRELVARIRAVLRRSIGALADAPAVTANYHFAGLIADPVTRSLADTDGTEVKLTSSEFELLRVFLDRPGRVLTREQLLDLTRGRDFGERDRSIDVLVSRLRRKLGAERGPQIFKTVRNGGYQLAVTVELRERPF
ncbi:MAG: response regulator [Pseudomonadota bacterium]